MTIRAGGGSLLGQVIADRGHVGSVDVDGLVEEAGCLPENELHDLYRTYTMYVVT